MYVEYDKKKLYTSQNIVICLWSLNCKVSMLCDIFAQYWKNWSEVGSFEHFFFSSFSIVQCNINTIIILLTLSQCLPLFRLLLFFNRITYIGKMLLLFSKFVARIYDGCECMTKIDQHFLKEMDQLFIVCFFFFMFTTAK